MITVPEAERIHNILIEEFGGSKGIRNKGSLESALFRPHQTFDGIDLYPDPISKAAALFESLIIDHPFVDGNKRIAMSLCD
jgi:death-on-curing protein